MFGAALSKLRKRFRFRGKKEEPKLFEDKAGGADSAQSVEIIQKPKKQFGLKSFKPRKHLPSIRLRLPAVKFNPRLVKAKSIMAGILAVIYFLSGIFVLPNPLAAIPLLSAYFLADYVWGLRKLKFFNGLLGEKGAEKEMA